MQSSAIVGSNPGRSISVFLTPIIHFFNAGSTSNPTVSQSPLHKSVSVGDTVSLSCTASSGVDDDLSWYLVQPGAPPQLLFYKITTSQSGTPSRFDSSGSEPEFTLTIRGVQAEDTGDYYCLGVYSGPVFTQ